MSSLKIVFTPPSPAPADGYIVQYRLKGSNEPYRTVFPNPKSSPVIIDNLPGSAYEGTITSECSYGMSTEISFVTPDIKNTCSDGYTFDSTSNMCVKVTSICATAPTGNSGTAGTAGRVQYAAWNNGGGRVFLPGYPDTGEGTVDTFLTLPHLWANGNFQWDASGRNNNDGRMNAAAVWVAGHSNTGGDNLPLNEWIGFSRKVTNSTGQPKQVYVGMCADNAFKFSLNGLPLVSIAGRGDNTVDGQLLNENNFDYMNLYPVTLKTGDNYVEMTALNTGNAAGFAAEIYDMTKAELLNALNSDPISSDNPRGMRIIFSTRDMDTQSFDVGETVGWSCPENQGYALVKNTTGTGCTYYCQKTETVSPT